MNIVAGALDLGRGGPDDNSAQANHLVAHALCARTQKSGDPTTDTFVTHTLTAEGHDASEDGTRGGTPLTTAFDPNFSNQAAPRDDGTMHPITTRGNGAGVATAQSVRRLTPTECERLQNFPDGWTILPETLAANPDESNPKPDSHRYAQMGNAVTVSVAHWLGKRIMEHESV